MTCTSSSGVQTLTHQCQLTSFLGVDAVALAIIALVFLLALFGVLWLGIRGAQKRQA